jgi:hypothetical protein
MHAIDHNLYEHFLAELAALDEQTMVVDGKELKPSQCYHLGVEPVHILFNTNCPDLLKQKLNALLVKYRFSNDQRGGNDQDA